MLSTKDDTGPRLIQRLPANSHTNIHYYKIKTNSQGPLQLTESKRVPNTDRQGCTSTLSQKYSPLPGTIGRMTASGVNTRSVPSKSGEREFKCWIAAAGEQFQFTSRN